MPQIIYLADDEKNIRDLIAAFLTQEGFTVQTFETGDARGAGRRGRPGCNGWGRSTWWG